MLCTPVAKRRVKLFSDDFESDGEGQGKKAAVAVLTPLHRSCLSASSPAHAKFSSSRGSDALLGFSGVLAFSPMTSKGGRVLHEVQTPENTTKSSFYTPPPAPCIDRNLKEQVEDVHSALRFNSVPLLCLSLQQGSRTCRCRFDHSIHEAVTQQQVAALEFLLQHGVKDSLNEPCNGSRPLSRAIRISRMKDDVGYQMASLLLEHGADPNLGSNTPLHEAASSSSPSAVALLCAHGANTNLVNNSGRTPLHIVCRRTIFMPDSQRDQVVQELLAHGADPTIRDCDGLRASDYAADSAAFSLFDSSATLSKLEDRLRRGERWWARRPIILARNANGHNVLHELPDTVFQAMVRFI